MLEDLTTIPPYEVDPSYYSDWGDPREYTIGDMGIGECAGEVVSVSQFALASADRLVFEAQLQEIYQDLRLPDEVLSGAYANAVMIGHSPAARKSCSKPFRHSTGSQKVSQR